MLVKVDFVKPLGWEMMCGGLLVHLCWEMMPHIRCTKDQTTEGGGEGARAPENVYSPDTFVSLLS